MINKIKALIVQSGFLPDLLLKGNKEYAELLNIKHHYRQRFNPDTIIYKGYFHNKKAILKIYIASRKNYERELYIYSQFKNRFKIWNEITVNLLSSGTKPLPYLILQETKGKALGDWFHVHNDSKDVVLQVLNLFTQVHTITPVLPRNLVQNFSELAYFLTINKNKRESLLFFDKSYQNRFIKLGEKIRPAWNKANDSFIFKDFNPANVLLTKNGFKIIDFDSIATGKRFYDYAFFYFVSIGSPFSKQIQSEIVKRFSQEEIQIINFLLCYLTLENARSFRKHKDEKKFKQIYQTTLELL